MSSRNPERLIFQDDRDQYMLDIVNGVTRKKPFVRDIRGWCLFGPMDVRGSDRKWQFMLTKLYGQKLPRVRVGCRYYTLREAWAHWGYRPGRGTTRNNECAQAIAIIRLMLLQAQAWGLLSLWAAPIRFDSTILKSKRK